MRPERPAEPEFESELRQGAGREWLEEAAEDERLTEKLRDRRTDLAGRLLDLVASGHEVRAETSSQVFTGAVVYTGTDYAVIDRGSDQVAIRFDCASWEIKPGTGARAPARASQSFKAHLAELEATDETIRALLENVVISGSIRTLATDHLVMTIEGADMLVPLGILEGVVRPKRLQR